MSENSGATPGRKKRSKRFLPPSQKYEIWLRLVRQEVTIAEAAATEQVDRSTIMRIRTVAEEGALAALAASKPGVGAKQRDYELGLSGHVDDRVLPSRFGIPLRNTCRLTMGNGANGEEPV